MVWSVHPSGQREFDNRLFYPSSISLYTDGGVVDVDEEFTDLGSARFWCGGFIVTFSSRRPVDGDVEYITRTLRDELAWIVSVECDVEGVERWLARGFSGGGGQKRLGQWRDERGRGVKRELREEMFI